jgi:hypothetical protein
MTYFKLVPKGQEKRRIFPPVAPRQDDVLRDAALRLLASVLGSVEQAVDALNAQSCHRALYRDKVPLIIERFCDCVFERVVYMRFASGCGLREAVCSSCFCCVFMRMYVCVRTCA